MQGLLRSKPCMENAPCAGLIDSGTRRACMEIMNPKKSHETGKQHSFSRNAVSKVGTMEITQDFPGGNIEVVSRQGNRIFLKQQLRDTTLWWFYWCFRLDDAPEHELEFVFTDGEVVGPWGPAYSTDRINWQWLGGAVDHTGFTFRSEQPGQTVYFCFCNPYQLADYHRFLSSFTGVSCIN